MAKADLTTGRPERRAKPERPLPGGKRQTDPSLTTRDCADRLGVDPDYILGEIYEGRLNAFFRDLPGKRSTYRISEVDFRTYVATFWRHSRTNLPNR